MHFVRVGFADENQWRQAGEYSHLQMATDRVDSPSSIMGITVVPTVCTTEN